MSAPSFESVKVGYANMWNSANVKSSRLGEVDGVVRRLLVGKDRYKKVEALTGVPWFFIACLHEREASGNFNTHLHNGDSLSNYTHHVPAGRPKVGHGPPFTWEESAVDALNLEGFGKIKSWSVEQMLYSAEAYNGWGYTAKGINSPYVWGATDKQQPGKYVADGVWSSSAIDTQIGVAALLKRMASANPEIAQRLGAVVEAIATQTTPEGQVKTVAYIPGFVPGIMTADNVKKLVDMGSWVGLDVKALPASIQKKLMAAYTANKDTTLTESDLLALNDAEYKEMQAFELKLGQYGVPALPDRKTKQVVIPAVTQVSPKAPPVSTPQPTVTAPTVTITPPPVKTGIWQTLASIFTKGK